ncbi:MAG: SPOR domain-containing protein [Bacteroidota bacterium]
MAAKDKDEDKFDDDEDFGLPELHYEELDDDNDSSSEEEEKKEEPTPDPFSDESSSESSDQSFYEEESFDEFKEDAEPIEEASTGSVFDSDDSSSEESYGDFSTESSFTTSESSYETPAPQPYTEYYNEDSSRKAKSNFTRIVIIGSLLFASIAIVFYFVGGLDLIGMGEEKEEVAPKPAPVEPAPVDSSAFEPVEPEPVEPTPAQLPAGEIVTLDQRTGKSYVVIGSFFDGDLAMDFAKKLAENGNSPQIIPPFKDYRFHRVAIAQFDTFKEAEAQAPSYAEQFGREAWPLRY